MRLLILFMFGLMLVVKPSQAISVTLEDNGYGAEKPVSIGEHTVVLLWQGRLVAKNTKTQQFLWKFGHNLGNDVFRDDDGRWEPNSGLVLSVYGRIFTHSDTGKLYAVAAQSGKSLWSAQSGLHVETDKNKYGVSRSCDMVAMEASHDLLAVTDGVKMVVFNANNGRKLWQTNRPYNEDCAFRTMHIMPRVVLAEYFTDGASFFIQTNAYDRYTGRYLWSEAGYIDAKDSKDGHASLNQMYDSDHFDHPSRIHHHIRDEYTGATLKDYITEDNEKAVPVNLH